VIRLALVLALGAGVGGCAHHPASTIPTVVDRPVPVSCVPKDTPAAPTYPDTPSALLAAPGADERYHLLSEAYGPKNSRLGLLEGLVANCRSAAP
jgi:hypothetical protein